MDFKLRKSSVLHQKSRPIIIKLFILFNKNHAIKILCRTCILSILTHSILFSIEVQIVLISKSLTSKIQILYELYLFLYFVRLATEIKTKLDWPFHLLRPFNSDFAVCYKTFARECICLLCVGCSNYKLNSRYVKYCGQNGLKSVNNLELNEYWTDNNWNITRIIIRRPTTE